MSKPDRLRAVVVGVADDGGGFLTVHISDEKGFQLCSVNVRIPQLGGGRWCGVGTIALDVEGYPECHECSRIMEWPRR